MLRLATANENGNGRARLQSCGPVRRLLSWSVKCYWLFFMHTVRLLSSSLIQELQKRRVLASKRFQIDFLVVWDAILPTAIDDPDPFVGQCTDRCMMAFPFVYLHLVIVTRPC